MRTECAPRFVWRYSRVPRCSDIFGQGRSSRKLDLLRFSIHPEPDSSLALELKTYDMPRSSAASPRFHEDFDSEVVGNVIPLGTPWLRPLDLGSASLAFDANHIGTSHAILTAQSSLDQLKATNGVSPRNPLAPTEFTSIHSTEESRAPSCIANVTTFSLSEQSFLPRSETREGDRDDESCGETIGAMKFDGQPEADTQLQARILKAAKRLRRGSAQGWNAVRAVHVRSSILTDRHVLWPSDNYVSDSRDVTGSLSHAESIIFILSPARALCRG